MKRKTCISFIISVATVMISLSCKHQIPGQNDVTVLPVTSTSCSPDTTYFQQQVLPVFISNCSMSGCHDEFSHQSGVVLTSYNSIMSSGGIRPGNPSGSKSYKMIVAADAGDRMPRPPMAPLNQQQMDIIRTWILQGAKNNSCESSACDTAHVSYSGSIKPLIALKCQGCHSGSNAQGGIDLSSYSGVQAKVNDGRLWGSINQMQGFSAMPKGGTKLSTCELDQFRLWINSGAPNN